MQHNHGPWPSQQLPSRLVISVQHRLNRRHRQCIAQVVLTSAVGKVFWVACDRCAECLHSTRRQYATDRDMLGGARTLHPRCSLERIAIDCRRKTNDSNPRRPQSASAGGNSWHLEIKHAIRPAHVYALINTLCFIKKTWQYIRDHNYGKSWWILRIFTYLVTAMNALRK